MPLYFEKEEDNDHDETAYFVKVPQCPPDMLDMVTGHAMQTVRDINDSIIGRVPKSLSPILHNLFQSQSVKVAMCFYTGFILHGGNRKGGGPQLEAMYLLEANKLDIIRIATMLDSAIKSQDIYL